MKIIDCLSSLEKNQKEKREEGYIVYPLIKHSTTKKEKNTKEKSNENHNILIEYIRNTFKLNQKHIEIIKVHIPRGASVSKHKHPSATEIFIPDKILILKINGKKITATQPIKIPKNTSHSIQGEQIFYAIKAYNNIFDKTLLIQNQL